MLATVTFDVLLPPEVSQDQAEEWLRFRLGATSSMSIENPMVDAGLEIKDSAIKVDFYWDFY
ncbi:hypothetical protein QU487_06705 [Crenobacter sp. SG2305]|uniref:hypothetical protein n=1 Tax=Crenobacter oryzisoli TaxID=3056844 RepID=UPI0025AB3427|nr:hypothetical protein [Crenobacter sp. SG2305]MDN0082444.1 hypothetical protein [Crenobacter sp. SG2305]